MFLKAVVFALVVVWVSLAPANVPSAPNKEYSSALDCTYTDPTGHVTLRFASRDWIRETDPESNDHGLAAPVCSLRRTAKPKDLPHVLISFSSDHLALDELAHIYPEKLLDREEGLEFMGFALSSDENCKILVFENRKFGYSEILYLAASNKGWVSVQETFQLNPTDSKSPDPEDTAAIRAINDNLTINK